MVVLGGVEVVVGGVGVVAEVVVGGCVVVVGGVGLPLLPPLPPIVIVCPFGMVSTHDVIPGPQPTPPPEDGLVVPGPVAPPVPPLGPGVVVTQGFAAVGA